MLTTWKVITREEARRIIDAHPNWTWFQVPADEKELVMSRVNENLAKEKIPEVHADVLRWRMSYAIRNGKRNARRPHLSLIIATIG